MPHRMTAQDLKYQAEDDVRTLIRAGEIKRDKKRMKRAMDRAKEQAKELETVKNS